MLLETIFSVTSAYLSTIFNFYKSPSFLCNVFSSAKFSFLMPYSFNVFRMHNRVFIFYISEFTKCSIPFDCKHFPHFTLASSLQCTVFRFCPQPGLLDERMSWLEPGLAPLAKAWTGTARSPREVGTPLCWFTQRCNVGQHQICSEPSWALNIPHSRKLSVLGKLGGLVTLVGLGQARETQDLIHSRLLWDWVNQWKSLSRARLFATPWTIQNTGVGSLSLLQGIFPTQGSNPGLLHCRWILHQMIHGIQQNTGLGVQITKN